MSSDPDGSTGMMHCLATAAAVAVNGSATFWRRPRAPPPARVSGLRSLVAERLSATARPPHDSASAPNRSTRSWCSIGSERSNLSLGGRSANFAGLARLLRGQS